MPTTAEHPSESLQIHHPMQVHSHSWTDDLPVCPGSAVGFSTNQIYREDGAMCREHEFEDRSFHFRPNVNTRLYGVFDGHDGTRASNFASQRLPAELLLGQLCDNATGSDIKQALRQAVEAVEKGFLDSIDDKLAEIANLQIQMPEDMKSYDVYKQYPEVFNKLHSLKSEISGGTTAVIGLVHNNILYVANVGDSRALLIKRDKISNKLEVMQLSVDHNVQNEDELLRLSRLGLDIKKLCQVCKLGNQYNTRCIGNYDVKGGYKNFDILSSAENEPVIADPNIFGEIEVDDSCLFLLLLSSGLYKSLESATSTSQVNADIASMVMEQFNIQLTLPGVAQAVVDKVVRIHNDVYLNSQNSTSVCASSNNQSPAPRASDRHEDITLLVCNFNMTMIKRMSGLTLLGGTQLNPVNRSPTDGTNYTFQSDQDFRSMHGNANDTDRTVSCNDARTNSDSLDNTSTSQSFSSSQNMSIDIDGRVTPYVDFSEYYAAIAEAESQGTNVFLDADLVEGWTNDECGVIKE